VRGEYFGENKNYRTFRKKKANDTKMLVGLTTQCSRAKQNVAGQHFWYMATTIFK